ncbi:ABC transporter ATP-binding protein [Azospirillum canadense]|uniref:ABC transporter ATP-binding protein n=1 Tax=Azospirillum canadense TaxID=403962 RepID=UPI002225BAFE
MGPQPILQGVSLDVPAGGIVTVLGSNGVGKTTLMRAISGVYKVGGGEIRLDGTPITNRTTHDIVRLGVCQAPEGRQIFSSMTVLENLRLGAGPRGGREYEQDLERMLGLFPRLRERLSQKAGSLSGGEQQMLCVGRALMGRPRLLLMDEPSLGLAPKLVRQIFDLVATIRETGTAILLVEQNAKAALRVADQAYVMESGRIVLQGPATELAEDPRIRAAYLGGHVH